MDMHSLEAWEDIKPSVNSREAQVLSALQAFYPKHVTADELADHMHRRKDHVMPRLTGLLDKGLVVKIPGMGVSRYGKTCNVWKAKMSEGDQPLLGGL